MYVLRVVSRIKQVEPAYKAVQFSIDARKMEEHLRNCSGLPSLATRLTNGSIFSDASSNNPSGFKRSSTKQSVLPPIERAVQLDPLMRGGGQPEVGVA
jgi:hypothetical protein